MNFNPFSLIPNLMRRAQTQGISSLIPSLDSVVKIADPRFIPTESWLRGIVDQTIMPVASAILLFALSSALIQEQRRAASGTSDFTRVLYRLLFHVAVLAGYPFFFGWIIDATQALGGLFLSDDQIGALTNSMFQQFSSWNLGAVTIGRVLLLGAVAYLTYLAAFILFFLFFLARYMILSLLFVIGPVIVAFGVWEETSRFRAWLVGLVQVASWVVILKFIIAVSLSFSFDKIYGATQVNLFYVIAANILYVVMIWHTPAIASTLVGGISLGFLGSQVIGVTTQKTMEASSGLRDRFFPSSPWSPVGGQGAGHGPMTPTPAPQDPYGSGVLWERLNRRK